MLKGTTLIALTAVLGMLCGILIPLFRSRGKAKYSKAMVWGALFGLLSGFMLGKHIVQPFLRTNPSPSAERNKPENNDFSGNINTELPPAPDVTSSEREKWVELLQRNPKDKKIWSSELNRLEKMAHLYTKLGEKPDVDKDMIDIAFANNYQLKGIALRHLERYSESLEELTKSQGILGLIEQRHGCAKSKRSNICLKVFNLSSMTFNCFSNVYQDLNDETNTLKYIQLSLDYSFKSIESTIVSRDKKSIVDASSKVESLYRKLFQTISWYPDGNTMRGNDPRDFVEMWGIGIGRNLKYGMSDAEEDIATFATIFVQQDLFTKDLITSFDSEGKAYLLKEGKYGSMEELMRNLDVETYVRNQIDEGNFEPAAKYLYARYIGHFFYSTNKYYLRCPQKKSFYITFQEVSRGLERTPSLKVAAWTRHIIEILHKGNMFLETHCQK